MRNIKSLFIVFTLVAACMMSCKNSEAETPDKTTTSEAKEIDENEENQRKHCQKARKNSKAKT